MPDKRTAWACVYGCARNVITNRSRMVEHERGCFKNPDTRSCPTCEHDRQDWDDDGTAPSMAEATFYKVRWCDIEKCPEDKTATRNCAYWLAKATPKESSPIPEGEVTDD